MNNKFKVGDRVRIIAAKHCQLKDYINKVCAITDISETGHYLLDLDMDNNHGLRWYWWEEELVYDFKIGDIVRVVDTKHDCKKYLVGHMFNIRNVYEGVGNRRVYGIGEKYLVNDDEIELAVKCLAEDRKPKFDINEYPGKYAMYCRKEDDAYIFCRYLHSIGKKWITDRTYIETQHFHSTADGTVYFFNDGNCCSYRDHLKYNDGKYEVLNFEDFDWSDFIMKKKFTKADLKNGDVILRRNGNVEIACIETGTFITPVAFNCISDVKDDLTTYGPNKDWDIIAVRRPIGTMDCQFSAFKFDFGELVYERKEVEEMTLAEVCKALGKEIKIVKEK